MRRINFSAGAVVVALLFMPAAAGAQSGLANPFAPGIPTPTPTVTTQTAPSQIAVPTTSTSGSGSLSGGAAVAIGVGALVVLGGISFFIWRDARRRAPVRHRIAEPGLAGAGGSKPRPKPRKLSPAERRRRKRGRAR